MGDASRRASRDISRDASRARSHLFITTCWCFFFFSTTELCKQILNVINPDIPVTHTHTHTILDWLQVYFPTFKACLPVAGMLGALTGALKAGLVEPSPDANKAL